MSILNHDDIRVNGDIGVTGSIYINESLYITTVQDPLADTNRFVVQNDPGSSDGRIGHRTGAELLSDLSGDCASTFFWGNQSLSAVGTLDCTNILITTLTAGRIPYADGSSILQSTNLYYHYTGMCGVGTDAPEAKLHVNIEDSGTNTMVYPLIVSHNTSGSAEAGIGSGIVLSAESIYSENVKLASIEAVNLSPTGSTQGELIFKTVDQNDEGLGLQERLRIIYTGHIKISKCDNAATDTDKFLVLDSKGHIDFRTGTELSSDIDIPVKTSGNSIQYTMYDGATSRGTGNAWWYKRDGVFRLQIQAKTGTITASTGTYLLFDAGIIPTPIFGSTIVIPGSILHNNVNAIGTYHFGTTSNRVYIYTGANSYLDAGNGGSQSTEFSYRYA